LLHLHLGRGYRGVRRLDVGLLLGRIERGKQLARLNVIADIGVTMIDESRGAEEPRGGPRLPQSN